MTEETKDRVTFVEFAHAHPEMQRACTCGAKSGHAHPVTCEQRKSWDEIFHAWVGSGRCFVNMGHWAGK